MNLPKALLPHLQLEIEVNTRINEKSAQWNFLQKWNGDQIRQPIITNKAHSLVISRQVPKIPDSKTAKLGEYLDYYYAQPRDEPEPVALMLTEHNPVLAHFQTETLLVLMANFNNQGAFELISLRYRNDLLSVPSTQTQKDATGFIPGLSFVASKINSQGQRFQIGLRVFIEKKVFQQIIDNATNVLMIPLPVVPQLHQQKYFQMAKLKIANRFHPYLRLKLAGGQQKMVSSEHFQVGGECWLTRLVGARKNVTYKFEYFLYKIVQVKRDEQLIYVNQLLSSGCSQAQRTSGWFFHRFARPLHFGQKVADLTAANLHFEDEEAVCEPAFVQVKVYQLFKEAQIQYVGFANYPVPMLPGRRTVKMYLSCPKRDRFEAQKVQYGYSGVGTAVDLGEERFGLEQSNFQMQVELEFNVFHSLRYIQTAQGKKMNDLGGVQQKLSKGFSNKLMGMLESAARDESGKK